MTAFENSLSYARELDANDPLKDVRSKFIIPVHDGKEQAYFLGNSLGLQPKTTKAEISKILDDWGSYGVEAFFMGDNPWLHYHEQLTKPLSLIVGALPEEISVMNQLTVNLHLMLASFYLPTGKRKKILCEAKAFPSDQYMLETHAKHHGLDPEEIIVEVTPRPGEHKIQTEDILTAINQHKSELALILFSGLNYYSGQVFDMKMITEAGHAVGAKVGFDLAHAAGNIELKLHEWNIDFACWCNYKYLNSGPGAIGGVFIHERFHRNKAIPRLAGWWGYDKATRFNMEKGFQPIPSAEGWQLSTPSPILYSSHKAALDIIQSAGWYTILEKSRLLNDYLWHTIDDVQNEFANRFTCITPRSKEEKGSQVSLLTHSNGRKLFDKLTRAGFITDWREPDLVRLAPVPLYNTYEEVWRLGQTLKKILAEGL
jgi:kynureninase